MHEDAAQIHGFCKGKCIDIHDRDTSWQDVRADGTVCHHKGVSTHLFDMLQDPSFSVGAALSRKQFVHID